MADVVRVVAARIPDRDRLLALLSENGHDARPVNGVEIDVHYAPSVTKTRIYSEVEQAVIPIGDTFNSVQHHVA